MTEETILAIDREGDVANCAVTEYGREAGGLVLRRYNMVAPLLQSGAPITREPDAKVAAR
jgi:hypothetical protein